MGRTGHWVGVLLLLCGGCRCEAPAPEFDSTSETAPDMESPSSADVESKAHCGVDPEIRKARRAKQIAREAEEARVRGLQVQAAEIDAENARQIEALRKRNQACASDVTRQDPECAAFVEGRSDSCAVLEGRKSEDCGAMALLGGAIRTGDVLACDGVEDRGFRALCRGAVTGEYTCRSRGRGALWKACRALQSARPQAVCAGSRRDRDACNVVELITAIGTGTVANCAGVSRRSARALCEAWYTGVEKCLRPVGSAAPQCRDILLSPPTVVVGSEGAWKVRYINLFSESATCEVLMRGGAGPEVRVKLGVLASGSGLHEKEIPGPPERVGPLDARASCVWEAP